MNAMEGMVPPLDAARARVLRFLGPFASPLLADREARVGVYGAFAIAAAFALTCTAPRWVLTFGPLALGVPHLIADVRYLVVRTGLYRRSELWIAMGFPVLAAGLVGHVGVGLLAPLGAAVAARAAAWKKGLALALWGAISLWARQSPRLANLVVAHGHNLLAVGIFWAWTARKHRHHWPALAAFLGAPTLLGSGMLDGLVSPLAGAGAVAHGSLEFKALADRTSKALRGGNESTDRPHHAFAVPSFENADQVEASSRRARRSARASSPSRLSTS
jgi:hypothetical protein